ncbi:hypothetical protein [Phenylobacterium sp. J367]|uniref:hypothetical protein n=1 Tax=Phenylobacterium sp. J367 TaxID=2898435 RepID=UPI002151CF36|nr:hypothetical protein [Phenylobacterium sp. J367]MCR5878813.1 hypothetical protein [Phenylobacterium sp. J367]
MASLALGTVYDAVICPFFGLAHLPAGTAWRNTFKGVAKHLRPGGLAAFHLPLAERMQGPAPPPDQPVARHVLPDGRTLTLYVAEKAFRPDIGRFSLALDYVSGAERRREQLTYYLAHPVPLAEASGLALDRPATRLGDTGEVFVFRRAADA